MNFPIKLLSLLFLLAIANVANGCAFIPAPLLYMNNIKTVYDTASFLTDTPTSNDIVLSSLTGKNCRVSNMIDNLDVCNEKTSTEKMQDYVNQDYENDEEFQSLASIDTGIIW